MRLRGGNVVLSVVVVAALLASAAFAAKPVAGASYRGALVGGQSAVTISFRVSSDGSKVTGVSISKLPIYCVGRPPPAAKISFQAAHVGRGGAFTAKGRDAIAFGPLKGTAVATLELTGSFGSGRRESGTITTTFAGSGSKCSGHSSYATKS
jgi:hypothetical protein